MCGALLLVAAAVIAIPHAGVSAATVTPPKPLLGAKLAGKVWNGNGDYRVEFGREERAAS